jgi:transcriptional regulator with XRE-family HTH domain
MAADSLGTRIKRARERKRWTQQELANRVGVNRKTIDNWENDRAVPRSSLGALEATLAPFFTVSGGVPDPPADPRERELYDLAIVEAGPDGAWAVIEEYRRRKRRTA